MSALNNSFNGNTVHVNLGCAHDISAAHKPPGLTPTWLGLPPNWGARALRCLLQATVIIKCADLSSSVAALEQFAQAVN